jgi:hypothetical protein
LHFSDYKNKLYNILYLKVMKEKFLHFIWQFQYFNKKELLTESGETVDIFFPGIYNVNAGPDFSEAHLRIGDMDWHGDVEIHYRSSEWEKHHHRQDKAYNRVILHVVWENDLNARRADDTLIPTIALKGRVKQRLINGFNDMVNFKGSVACAGHFKSVTELTKLGMLDKALSQRLERKSEMVLDLWQHNGNDWETTAYQFMAYNFGFKINNEPFLALARSLPMRIIAKHSDNLTQLEALLFGLAGFLSQEEGDTYYTTLRKEYLYLSKKYKLEAYQLQAHRWKFLRLRPSNFPTVRIAQFATLLYKNFRLFSLFKTFTAYEVLREKLKVEPSPYWKEHYLFGKNSKAKLKGLGENSLRTLLINTAPALLAAYSRTTDSPENMEKAMQLLETMPAENNKIIRIWKNMGFKAQNAFDSQAMIELYNEFCRQKQCLRCNIGVSIMKKFDVKSKEA